MGLMRRVFSSLCLMTEEESAFENLCTEIMSRLGAIFKADLCIDNGHKYLEEHSKVTKLWVFGWRKMNKNDVEVQRGEKDRGLFPGTVSAITLEECGKPWRLLQDYRYQHMFEEAASGIKFQIFTATKA